MDANNNNEKLSNEGFLKANVSDPISADSNSFEKLVKESNFEWGVGENEVFDKIVFQDEELYDVTQDSFRYGRVTSGTSYNLVTGKMPEEVLEAVKSKDEERDDLEDPEELVTEVESENYGNFLDMYDTQMPKYFEYRSTFPEVKGIWTLLFDQDHYKDMSTYELQAAICAALNSKHHQIVCIGVDSFNSVTGVEMSAVDRVVFRMALTRAVAGEFQPPLVNIPAKQLTGVTPMKRDVSELTPSIDVLFVPVIGAPSDSGDDGLTNRFLIVVRVKDLSEKFYQLSSGRIYFEQEGRVVEMPSLDEAFRALIVPNFSAEPMKGSMFMREPVKFIEDAFIPMEHCELGSESVPEAPVHSEACKPTNAEVVPLPKTSIYESICDKLENFDLEHFGWLLFGSALTFCIYRHAIKPLLSN